jgi:hypothetical protein
MWTACAFAALEGTTETWPGYPESDEDQIRKLLGEMTTEAAWTA